MKQEFKIAPPLLALLVSSCLTVKKTDLGHGFVKVTRRGPGAESIERYSYLDYLKYGSNNLGEVGFVSVAPSGRFVIYEQDGKLLLYSIDAHSSREVTDGSFALPRHVAWREESAAATVTYYDGHDPSSVSLNMDRRLP